MPHASGAWRRRRLILLAAAVAVPAAAQTAAAPQRPSFSTDTSTTAPGTVELEIGGSALRGLFAAPTTIKATPDVDSGPFRNLEWSVSFDGIVDESGRSPRFGDALVLAARKRLFRRGGFSLGAAPALTVFRSGANGVRGGATAIGVYQFGRNTLIGNLTWSAASEASDSNPSWQADWIAGIARTYGDFSLFGEVLVADPSSGRSSAALMQGLAFALRPDVVLDFALQQSDVAQEAAFGAQFGLTVNFGRF